MFLLITRAIKEGWNNFFRNGYLSVATVSVMLLSLFTISFIFVVMLTADSVLKGVEERVDISVYFKSSVTDESIFNAKKDLENFQEVRSVEYVSKDQALENFKKNNADNQVILQSLEEIGENPLVSYLIIKAKDSNQYNLIGEYLTNASFKNEIKEVNYGKNKDVIDSLNEIIAGVRKVGFGVASLFSLISLLIISNTVRVTIYTHRKEVEVMRLVGASNMYIRLPFIFEGIIYGIVASIISMALLFIVLKSSEELVMQMLSNMSMLGIYSSNFVKILGLQILVGSFLGVLSSWFAIRKYLKI